MTIKTEQIVVTPEMAARWLANNPNIRKLRNKYVENISRSIEGGHFRVTHQGIAIRQDGALVDGQHRLSAIVRTGRSVSMLVSTGLTDEDVKVIDSGMKRQSHERIGADRHRVQIATAMLTVLGVRRSPLEWEIELLLDVLDDRLSFCESHIDGWKHKKRTGSAPALAAMLLLLEKMKGDQSSIDESIRLMSKALRGDLFEAPQSVISYYRQMTEGVKHIGAALKRRGGSSQVDAFVRAWVAFQPANRSKSRIQVKDATTSISDAVVVFDALTSGVFTDDDQNG